MAINTPPIKEPLPVIGQAAVWTKAWANWYTRAWQILSAAEQSGTTANRPTETLFVGRPYFDTTLGKPIWVNTAGTGWVDATGTGV